MSRLMENLKKYYLVEDDDSNLDYSDGRVIALHPQVAYYLSQRGISYHIPEDFYDEKELVRKHESFFQEQLDWFDQFDVFLQEHISYCKMNGIRLARAYYNRIKYFVDALIIQSWILDRIIRSGGHDAYWVYVKKSDEVRKTMQDFKNDESTYFDKLLPKICQAQGNNRFSIYHFTPLNVPLKIRKKNFWVPGFIQENKTFRACLKGIQFFMRYGGFFRKHPGKGGLKVLFMHSGSHHLEPLIEKFIDTGNTVFFYNDERIYSIDHPSQGIPLIAPALRENEEVLKISRDCARLSENFDEKSKNILRWINDQSGIGISDFVVPYFRFFVEKTCPELLIRSKAYAHVYAERDIQFVVTHTSSDIDSKSAILASQIQGGVKTICVQHGCCQTFEEKVWLMIDVDPFDYYLTTDDYSQKYFLNRLGTPSIKPAKILQSSHYLKRIQSNSADKIGHQRRSYKKILYIPTKQTLYVRHFNAVFYPPVWYFEYQKKLMTYFESKKEYDFIYKHVLLAKMAADKSIIPYIQNGNFGNISIVTQPTVECFDSVDAVILDRPTTAFFEAVASGLPVLALYPDFVEDVLCAEAKEFFGKSLQRFDTPEKSFAHIEEFLRGNPLNYIHDLPMHDDPIIKIFSEERPNRTAPVFPVIAK